MPLESGQMPLGIPSSLLLVIDSKYRRNRLPGSTYDHRPFSVASLVMCNSLLKCLPNHPTTLLVLAVESDWSSNVCSALWTLAVMHNDVILFCSVDSFFLAMRYLSSYFGSTVQYSL